MPATNGTRVRSKKSVSDIKAKVDAAKSVDPKTKEANKTRRTKVKKDTAELSVEKAASSVARTKVQLQQSLDSLAMELNEKLDELKKVNEAIEIAREELEELHDKDVVASSIAELITTHEEKQKELQQRIIDVRAEWDKEQQAHLEAVRERDAALSKERKREADEYNYNLKIQRRNEEENYNEQIRQRNTVNQQKQETLLREWKEREEAIAAQENEIAELRSKIADFDQNVKDAVNKEVAIVTNKLKHDYQVESDRAAMQFNADKRVMQIEVNNLKSSIDAKNEQIQALQAEVSQAKDHANKLAISAMESASGKRALDAVNSFAERSGANRK